MTDVTRILSAIEQGDAETAEQLLPLVYKELRKLATAKMAQEKPGQTLQAMALVHEAYLRLLMSAWLMTLRKVKSFSGRRHVGQNCGRRGAAVPAAAKLGRHSFSEGQ
jgi:DNA-directed RNA polymerase specialized sigma24 family protein